MIHHESAHDLLSDADLARHLEEFHHVDPVEAAKTVHPSRLFEQTTRSDYGDDEFTARLAAYHEDAHQGEEL